MSASSSSSLVFLIASVALVPALLCGAWPNAPIPAAANNEAVDPNSLAADAWTCPTSTSTAPYYCSEYCGFYSLSFTGQQANDLTREIVEECPRDDCVNLFPDGETQPDGPFCLYNFTTPTAHVAGAKAVCCCSDNDAPCSETTDFQYIVAAKLAHTTQAPTSTTTEEPWEEETTTEDISTNSTPTWPPEEEDTTTESTTTTTDSGSSEEPDMIQVSKITCTHVMAISHSGSDDGSSSGKAHINYSAECDVEAGAMKEMLKSFFA